MNIIVLDPSLRNTGVFIINPKLDVVVHTEIIKTAKAKKKQKLTVTEDLDSACQFIAKRLCELIDTYKPSLALFETSAAAGKSATAARSLGIIKGLVWGVVTSKGVNSATLTEREVKQHLFGSVKAEKFQLMAEAVKHYPQLAQSKQWINKSTGELYNYFEHVADAICVYLTYKEKGHTPTCTM